MLHSGMIRKSAKRISEKNHAQTMNYSAMMNDSEFIALQCSEIQ